MKYDQMFAPREFFEEWDDLDEEGLAEMVGTVAFGVDAKTGIIQKATLFWIEKTEEGLIYHTAFEDIDE